MVETVGNGSYKRDGCDGKRKKVSETLHKKRLVERGKEWKDQTREEGSWKNRTEVQGRRNSWVTG